MRAILFSDLHLGYLSDSDRYHKIALDFAHWLKDEATARGITTLICCGDVFHNRKTVLLTTIHKCAEFFNVLSDFDLRVFPGNHDCWFLNNAEIHSTNILRNWSNITVYDKAHYEDVDGKTLGFIPWGVPIEDIESCDVMFGHFEINGFQMSSAHFCKNGVKASDLLDKAPLVISGHFHKAQGTSVKDKGAVLYLGSPYQQGWREMGQKKYVYEFDTSNNKIVKIENTKSPMHIKLKESEVSNHKGIEGNIVRVFATEETESAVLADVANKSPLDLEVVVESVDIKRSSEIIDDYKGVDIRQSFVKTILNLDKPDALKKDVAQECEDLLKLV